MPEHHYYLQSEIKPEEHFLFSISKDTNGVMVYNGTDMSYRWPLLTPFNQPIDLDTDKHQMFTYAEARFVWESLVRNYKFVHKVKVQI